MSKNNTNHLYIHPENQELLWSVMQKSALFQNMQIQYKHIWFKSIIQYFYEKYATTVITPEILQQLNRETIKYMLEALKVNQEPSIPVVQPMQMVQPVQPIPQQPTYSGKMAESMQKQEVYTKAFEQRQRDFQTLLAKPAAPEVNFKEKLEDEPIRNMEELIEQHRREREQLNHFVSNQINSVAGSPVPAPSPTNTAGAQRIQISMEPSNEVLPVIQVELKESVPTASLKKRVSWEGEDSSKEKDPKMVELEKKNEWLIEKYEELKREIDVLKKEFEQWRIHQTAKTVVEEIINRAV